MQPIRSFVSLLCMTILFNMVAAQGIEFAQGNWAEIQALSAEKGKPIFLDAYTSWCPPCKKMDRTTFQEEAIGGHFNATFVNYKLDMEKGEGPEIAKKYQIGSYPTYLWLDSDGEALYRVVGYHDPEALMEEAAKAMDPELWIGSMMERYEGGNRDPEFVASYLVFLIETGMDWQDPLKEYRESGALKGAELLKENNWKIFDHLFIRTDTEEFLYCSTHLDDFVGRFGEPAVQSKLEYNFGNEVWSLVRNKGKQKDFEALLSRTDQLGYTQIIPLKAWLELTWYGAKKKWKSYVQAASTYMKTAPGGVQDPGVLNDAAWQVYLKVKDEDLLNEALGWVERSIELEDEYFNRDTYAMLLKKLGRQEEAIEQAEIAIEKAKDAGEDYQSTRKELDKMVRRN